MKTIISIGILLLLENFSGIEVNEVEKFAMIVGVIGTALLFEKKNI